MGTVSPLFPSPTPVCGIALPPPGAPDAAAAPPAGLYTTGGRRGEYAIGDLARELKFARTLDRRRVIAKLRVLAEGGMPLPITPRIEKGVEITGPGAIHAHSLWDAREFDAWMDGRRPAGPAGALRPPVPHAIREAMAERARSMVA